MKLGPSVALATQRVIGSHMCPAAADLDIQIQMIFSSWETPSCLWVWL